MELDVVKAAKITLKYAEMCIEDERHKNFDRTVPPELSLNHQLNILEEIKRGRIFADKAHRCLGWVQAALCMYGIGDLITYRALNAACIKD